MRSLFEFVVVCGKTSHILHARGVALRGYSLWRCDHQRRVSVVVMGLSSLLLLLCFGAFALAGAQASLVANEQGTTPQVSNRVYVVCNVKMPCGSRMFWLQSASMTKQKRAAKTALPEPSCTILRKSGEFFGGFGDTSVHCFRLYAAVSYRCRVSISQNLLWTEVHRVPSLNKSNPVVQNIFGMPVSSTPVRKHTQAKVLQYADSDSEFI